MICRIDIDSIDQVISRGKHARLLPPLPSFLPDALKHSDLHALVAMLIILYHAHRHIEGDHNSMVRMLEPLCISYTVSMHAQARLRALHCIMLLTCLTCTLHSWLRTTYLQASRTHAHATHASRHFPNRHACTPMPIYIRYLRFFQHTTLPARSASRLHAHAAHASITY